MELLQKYIKEIAEDLKIDEINVKDVQMRTPARKHFWVARLINHKIELDKLKKKKKSIVKLLMQTAENNTPVVLSKFNLEKSIEEAAQIQEINDSIKENELIIELLEKTEKTFSSLTYDIKNITALMNMEQM
jgi:hypothetical protein